jgi:hypothetical protein
MAPGDTTDTPELFVDIITGESYSGYSNRQIEIKNQDAKIKMTEQNSKSVKT